ncbi:MAG: VCBS repeat-containing protein [Candidatus Zixiibacteriota bacterium]
MKNEYMLQFLIIVMLLCFSQNLLAGGENQSRLLEYASEDLRNKCDSQLVAFQERNKDGEWEFHSNLEIKENTKAEINGKEYTVLIIATGGFGELILIDSSGSKENILSRKINVPGMHVRIGKVLDLNKDGYDEITIYASGGAHGSYAYFLSLKNDTLSFIEKADGDISFFALVGWVHTKDFDKDGVFEIVVDRKPSEGKTESYDIYKWDGAHYALKDQVEK